MKLSQLTLTFDDGTTVDLERLRDSICIASEADLSFSDREMLEQYCNRLFELDFDFEF